MCRGVLQLCELTGTLVKAANLAGQMLAKVCAGYDLCKAINTAK